METQALAKRETPGNKEGRMGAEFQVCCSYRVFKREPQAQNTPPVLKPMISNLDLIPDLIAVSTSRRNIILINQYEIFWSMP